MTAKPKRKSAEALSKSRLRLWLRLLKTSRLIEDRIRKRFRDEFNTTLPRFDVMSALSRTPGGLKMSEISSLLRVSNGNITGIVDRLTEEELVVRVAVPDDRRASLVRLTPKGTEAFNEQAAAHEIWINEILSDFDSAEADAFIARLDRLPTTIEGGTS